MNAAHLHLLLNHIPVIGALFVLALFGIAVLRRDSPIAKLALWMSAALGVAAVAVYLTGEPAEDAVERLPGVAKSIVETHADAALVATVMMSAFGALALGALTLYRRRTLPRWVAVSSFAGMLT